MVFRYVAKPRRYSHAVMQIDRTFRSYRGHGRATSADVRATCLLWVRMSLSCSLRRVAVAITFRVDDVVRAADLAPTHTLAEHLGSVLAFGGDGEKKVLKGTADCAAPLLGAIHVAFAQHRPLSLSPDKRGRNLSALSFTCCATPLRIVSHTAPAICRLPSPP
jgi:hypothetical protein